MPSPKVPEAVLEVAALSWYEKKYGTKTFHLAEAVVQNACRETVRPIVEDALAQHHKELLGDEAKVAAGDALEANREKDYMGWSHVNEMVKVEVLGEVETVLQAAIDSVMKGEDGG